MHASLCQLVVMPASNKVIGICHHDHWAQSSCIMTYDYYSSHSIPSFSVHAPPYRSTGETSFFSMFLITKNHHSQDIVACINRPSIPIHTNMGITNLPKMLKKYAPKQKLESLVSYSPGGNVLGIDMSTAIVAAARSQRGAEEYHQRAPVPAHHVAVMEKS